MEKKNTLCPGCGKPLSGNSEYCYNCGRFIDRDTHQFIEDDKVTDDDLIKLVEDSLQAGKQWKHSAAHFRMVLGIVICVAAGGAAIALMGEIAMWKVLVLIFVLFGAGAALIVSAGSPPEALLTIAAWKKILGRTVIPSVLKEVLDTVEYDPDQSVDESRIRETDILQQKWDRFSGTDRIAGVYRGYPVEIGNILLEKEDENNDSDEARYDVVFKGLWIIVDLKKKQPADLDIIGYLPEARYLFKNIVELDNEVFNQRFQVRCTDRHEVFLHLTPVNMEKIMKLAERGRTCIKLMEDGRVAMAINGEHNTLFKVSKADQDIPELRNRFRSELKERMGLVDEILRIFGEE